MKKLVIAEAGPLIGLARTGYLSLFQHLYSSVMISSHLLQTLKLSSGKSGSRAIATAIHHGWLHVTELKNPQRIKSPYRLIDAEVMEAIQLATEQHIDLVLLDNRRGRNVAKYHGMHIIGTGGMLLTAKKVKLLDEVAPVLEELADVGYCFSPALWQRILELAHERS